MQPDLKKLITAFLGVALLSSMFSLAFMRSGAFQENTADGSGGTGLIQGQRNAFADLSLVTPPWRTSQASGASSDASIFASSNLTENFSQALSNGFNQAANGPGEIDKTALSTAMAKIESRVFLETDTPEIKINKNPTLQDKAAYIEEVRDILRLTSEGFLGKQANPSQVDMVNIVSLKNLFEKQGARAASLSVPADVVSLQKALLSFTGSYQKFFESLADYEKDPVKSLLAIQNKQKVLGSYTDSLVAELSKVQTDSNFSYHNEPFWFTNPVLSLLSPQTAYAQSAVIDIGSIIQTIVNGAKAAAQYAKDVAHYISVQAHQVWEKIDAAQKWVQTQLEWVEKLATEQLKNVLVQLMVRISVAWINGNGSPRFVTNWRVYTDDAFGLGVGKGLDEVADETCGMFGSTMVTQLSNSYNTFYRPTNCRQSETGQTLDRFRNNNFQDGGWGAYGMAVSPQGNYFQSYTRSAGWVQDSADKESKAAISDALASNGYKPTKDCPEYATAAASNEDGSENLSSPAEGGAVSTDPLPDGKCPDGSEPQNTTPGAVIGAVADKAFLIPGDRIVTAQNLVSLGFNLANGALTKVISSKNKGLTSLNEGSSLGTGAANASYSLTDTCSGFASGTPGYADCIGNAGAADGVLEILNSSTTNIQDVAAAGQALDNIKSDAESISRNRNSTVSINTDLNASLGELLTQPGLLDQVITACGNLNFTDLGRARIAEAEDLKNDLTLLSQNIPQTDIDQDLMAADLSILSQSTDAAQIRSLFNQFATSYGTVASTTQLFTLAQNRRVAVRQIKTQAESNLANPCNTAFSTTTIPAVLQNP